MMTTTELRPVLERARSLVSEGWTQRAFARNSEGGVVSEAAPLACAWCLEGALNAAVWERGGSIPEQMVTLREVQLLCLLAIPAKDDGRNLTNWNDAPRRTKGDVLRLLDRVIDGIELARAMPAERGRGC